ncbi:hypothetical protein ACFE04_030781 [Oxalis oulophora]
MGCCFSSTTTDKATSATTAPEKDKNYQNVSMQGHYHSSPSKYESKSPPRLDEEEEEEEEAVKEVVISVVASASAIVEEKKRLEKTELLVDKTETFNETSQVSETCSYTESFSTTTTTTIRDDGDEAVSKLSIEASHRRPRPYNRDVGGGGGGGSGRKRVPKPPAKRVDFMPEKKRVSQFSPSSSMNVHVRSTQRNVGLTRPRTPEKSGGRFLGNVSNEDVQSSNKEACVEKVESLENPHVSLECFIFL